MTKGNVGILCLEIKTIKTKRARKGPATKTKDRTPSNN